LADIPTSDLQKPLGTARDARARRAMPAWLPSALAAVPLGLLLGGGLYVGLVSHPDGGRPLAAAPIEEAPSPARPQFSFSAQDAVQPALQPAQQPPAESTAGQLEQDSGVRVLRPGGTDSPNSVIIRVPDSGVVRLAAAPDRRLTERSRHGILPRIGDDGARPSQVYARPVPPTVAAAPVRVAILMGGLGISASATADAIARLPGEVSLAFAPYGGDLEKLVQRARGDGHEVFLQVPMEPFDYPDNDPGPHTLTTGQSAPDNLERLRWVMSRIVGYVGIVNFMGGRFMSDEAALNPVLRELAERGLMVVDDGSSGRSLMLPAAAGLRAVALKADLVLDLTQRTDAIDRELARLEQQARERGFAVASASALPLSIDRVSRWARTLEQRGIKLVPVSSIGPVRVQTTGAIR
jgi:polysaccharide deacetylase 2 family uncharacterized protein YibQ